MTISDLKNDEIFYVIKTKIFSIKYVKKLGWLIFFLKFTEHKNLSVQITPYHNNFESGTFALGIDFTYRLKNADHTGFDMGLKLVFFDINIEFSDDRHVDDYKKENAF